MLIIRLILAAVIPHCCTWAGEPPPLASAKLKQSTGIVIRSKGRIQTGPSSRLELELPYLAVARIGSNASLDFSPDYRWLGLGGGTLLFSMPNNVGVGGISIRSGSVLISISKGALETSNLGGDTKVIALDGKVHISLTANPNAKKSLKFGQMVDVPAGATTMPKVVNIKLSTLLDSSALFKMGDFPGKASIKSNAIKQKGPPKAMISFASDADPMISQTGIAATANTTATILAQQAAQQQQQLLAQQAAVEQQQVQQAAQQAAANAARLESARQLAVQQEQQRQQQANQRPQGNQGNAFGPGGNQGQGQGQGQGNRGQGQGNQGNAFGPGGNPNNPNQGQGQGNQGQGQGQGPVVNPR